MFRNFVYLLAGLGSLGLMFFAAPSGALLTSAPQRGKVTREASGKRTVRGGGPVFIWLGGGYHGGK